MKIVKTFFYASAMLFALAGCDKKDQLSDNSPEEDDMEVTYASGDSAAISGPLAHFREHAGDPVNTLPVATGGRREINWDGVPPELSNNSLFPLDFFNPTAPAAPDGRKRGLLYFPADTKLSVSDKNFSNINPSYNSEFIPFSKSKVFSSIGTNITQARFQVPGTDKNAYVTSFGIVLIDVDNPEATLVQVYEGDTLIGSAKAKPSDKNFSFVGFHTHKHKITRVKITAGNTGLAAGVKDGSSTDLVVMDDFIYNEPQLIN